MVYETARGDFGDRARDVLQSWLSGRLAPAAVSISDFTAPPAGYSGRTAFFTASWTAAPGVTHTEELVLRAQARDHQLFATPDAPRQAEVIQRLAHRGPPLPDVVGVERDPALLGTPFYVMRRVRGRVPSDVPSWHKRGWTVELSADERSLMYDNGLRALASLHRIDDADTLGFLRGGPRSNSTALQRYLNELGTWYEWCSGDLRVGADTLAEAFRVIIGSAPDTDAETVVWGDARVGNMCFGDDLEVAALFDWEGATTGPPDIDVGWWLMFERFLCESLGFTRMPGVPDDDEVVARYVAFGGRLTGHVAYYQLLASFALSLINNRLSGLLIRDGFDSDTALGYPRTAVALVERYLERV